MGVHSFFYGYIKEAWSGSAANGCEELWKRLRSNDPTLHLHNESVLGAPPYIQLASEARMGHPTCRRGPRTDRKLGFHQHDGH